MKLIALAVVTVTFLLACESKPKIIEAVDTEASSQAPVSDEATSKLHKVVVEEVLQTSRYTYLNVSEDGEVFWIAIPKKDVEKGGTYYYRGGLKKTNFKSVEHDRVFETVYLVSDVSKDPGMIGMAGGNPHEDMGTPTTEQNTKLEPPPGGISIADLFANMKKYEGQIVRVKGRCVKLNNMIMQRNWIHLDDGSMKENKQDLTVTTTDNVPLGAIVAFEGKITLNKDFGAGYKYEIIMEDAHLLQ